MSITETIKQKIINSSEILRDIPNDERDIVFDLLMKTNKVDMDVLIRYYGHIDYDFTDEQIFKLALDLNYLIIKDMDYIFRIMAKRFNLNLLNRLKNENSDIFNQLINIFRVFDSEYCKLITSTELNNKLGLAIVYENTVLFDEIMTDINDKDSISEHDVSNLFMLSCYYGTTDTTKKLIDLHSSYENTVLDYIISNGFILSCTKNNNSVSKFLIDNYLHLEYFKCNSNVFMKIFAENDNDEMFLYLLELGVEYVDGDDFLYLAILHTLYDSVEFLLNAGVELSTSYNGDGDTCLLSIDNDDDKMIELLIEHGLVNDINNEEFDEQEIDLFIYWVIRNNDTNIMKHLMDGGMVVTKSFRRISINARFDMKRIMKL